jgi:excinuclease ABC subunit A
MQKIDHTTSLQEKQANAHSDSSYIGNGHPETEAIEIYGAREHNLKNIDAWLPRNQLIVITGISGSGKSSLAFDTINAEGQRRYMESFSAYARSFIGNLERPDVDKINGLSPVISIEQKTTSRNPRSTVGTVTEIYDFIRLLFARASEAFSYLTGEKMVRQSEDQVIDQILQLFDGQKLVILGGAIDRRDAGRPRRMRAAAT